MYALARITVEHPTDLERASGQVEICRDYAERCIQAVLLRMTEALQE